MRQPELPRTGAFGRVVGEVGLEGAAATALLRACPDAASPSRVSVQDVRATLADLIPVAPWPLAGDAPALIVLVGPAGVGKTTTAAKLGAQAIGAFGKSVTFICYDTFRVGATAQLDRFATRLGARMESVRTSAELRRAIALSRTDLVIVDTAGRPPKDQGGLEVVVAGDSKRPASATFARSRNVLLCLPAALRAVDADRWARTFGHLAPTGLVITKLDETSQRAGLWHGPVAAKLAVRALCFGQNIPEDIAPATRARVLELLVPRRAERQRAAS
jgi:flagellar biosynthesis protein FlhF